MASRRIVPPWDYLREASDPSLESFELSRLNHAANLRKEIGALIEQWIAEMSEAFLARWLRQGRKSPAARSTCSPKPNFPSPRRTPFPFDRAARIVACARDAARPFSDLLSTPDPARIAVRSVLCPSAVLLHPSCTLLCQLSTDRRRPSPRAQAPNAAICFLIFLYIIRPDGTRRRWPRHGGPPQGKRIYSQGRGTTHVSRKCTGDRNI